jgi:hypothetical protein
VAGPLFDDGPMLWVAVAVLGILGLAVWATVRERRRAIALLAALAGRYGLQSSGSPRSGPLVGQVGGLGVEIRWYHTGGKGQTLRVVVASPQSFGCGLEVHREIPPKHLTPFVTGHELFERRFTALARDVATARRVLTPRVCELLIEASDANDRTVAGEALLTDNCLTLHFWVTMSTSVDSAVARVDHALRLGTALFTPRAN